MVSMSRFKLLVFILPLFLSVIIKPAPIFGQYDCTYDYDCGGCEFCDSWNGVCVGISCSGCQSCNGSHGCSDNNFACPGCKSCSFGNCYDDNVYCPDGLICSGGSCIYPSSPTNTPAPVLPTVTPGGPVPTGAKAPARGDR
jgi:hypothetical protein